MHVLGLVAYQRGGSAALLHDGRVLAAAEEARFTRDVRAEGFPEHAVRHCLETGGVRAADVAFIALAGKPFRRVERVLETSLACAPRGLGAFRHALPRHLSRGLFVARDLDRALGLCRKPYVFVPRHEALAGAAFFGGPFERAAILTLDGPEGWTTTALGSGQGSSLRILQELGYPHALPLFATAIALYLGFATADGPGEVMELAPTGEPRFAEALLRELVEVRPDGSFWLDADFLPLAEGSAAPSPRLAQLLGGPPRAADEPIEARHRDVAASAQRVLEDALLACARHLQATTSARDLVLAGDGAANARANGRLLREGPFERVWAHPAASGPAAALGAALFVHHQLAGNERAGVAGALSAVGPEPGDARAALAAAGIEHELFGDADRDREVAALLADGALVAWCTGRAGLGDAALAGRCVLADASRAGAREAIQRRVAFQEPFRAVAACVPEERAAEWFDVPQGFASPSARLEVPVRAEARARLPAVVQPDGTARVLTVSRSAEPRLHALLAAFAARGLPPVLACAPLRQGSAPVAQSAADAARIFLSSGADALALDGALARKSRQTAEREARAVEAAPAAERDPALADLLRCPGCGAVQRFDGERATCMQCGAVRVREEGIWRFFHPDEPFAGDVTELVKGFYEEHPFPNYDEDESLRSLTEKARRGIYARLLGEQLPFASRVLEVGCGTGQLSNFLGIGSRTVFGADLCLNSLRLAEGFRARHGLQRVRFLQMNLFRPAFAPGSFDVVLCNGVLLTTRDPRAGFRSIARLVRPGGHIVIGLYNTYGRLAVDSRRVFFRLTGGRMRWVDPHMRKLRMSPAKQDAWFHDQYKHPHETKQTYGEVLDWFEESGFDFVSSVPKTSPWESFGEGERLFAPAPRGTALDRALTQAKMIVTGNREGGFFIMIGRRREGA